MTKLKHDEVEDFAISINLSNLRKENEPRLHMHRRITTQQQSELQTACKLTGTKNPGELVLLIAKEIARQAAKGKKS